MTINTRIRLTTSLALLIGLLLIISAWFDFNRWPGLSAFIGAQFVMCAFFLNFMGMWISLDIPKEQ